MGNRAVITASSNPKAPSIYLHWNGGTASVEAFFEAARLLGMRWLGDDIGADFDRQAQDSDLIKAATEIRVRAQRRAGEMLAVTEKAAGARGVGTSAVPEGNRTVATGQNQYPAGTSFGADFDRLAELIARHFFNGHVGFTVYRQELGQADTSNHDNGTYVIDRGFRVIHRYGGGCQHVETDPEKTAAIVDRIVQRAPIFNY